MNNGGDAAEQVVRLSLEGFEVAAKLTGSAAKNVAILLMSVLKEESKTKGKQRLSNMIRSGKELKVYSVPNKDLKKFVTEAKRYGVLYCVLRDKGKNNENGTVDVIARAEDASKIQRIFDKFELASVESKATVVSNTQKEVNERKAVEKDKPTKSKADIIADEALKNPTQPEKAYYENPTVAKTEKSPPLEPHSRQNATATTDKGAAVRDDKKPSVREKLNGYKEALAQQKKSENREQSQRSVSKNGQTKHKQPQRKKSKKHKSKER